MPVIPTDVLATRIQGAHLDQRPGRVDEHGGKMAPEDRLWPCRRCQSGRNFKVWGLLRCQCLYRAGHPAWRGRRLPGGKNSPKAPPPIGGELDGIQVLLRPGAPLRAPLPPQGTGQIGPGSTLAKWTGPAAAGQHKYISTPRESPLGISRHLVRVKCTQTQCTTGSTQFIV